MSDQPPHPEGDTTPEGFNVARNHRLEVIAARRPALLDARDNSTVDADILAIAGEPRRVADRHRDARHARRLTRSARERRARLR